MPAASNALSSIDSAQPQTFEIRPFSGAVGAEIIGLDLAKPVSAEDFTRIHRAHLDHHVLVFRDQRISPEQQIAFSRRFGELQIHVLKQFLLTGHPEILIVSNIVEHGQNIGLGDAGKFWHSDLSYKELPSLGSMLHAQELPSEGGDTLFADMHKAWDAVPEALRRGGRGPQCRSLLHRPLCRNQIRRQLAPDPDRRAIGAGEGSHPPGGAYPPGKRPQGAVRQRRLHHPHRRPADDESRDVLQQLYALSVLEQNIYRHQWQPHDLVFWDNRSLIHLAAGCPAHLRRKLFRTTIQGDAPF
jgi:Probable taurine catabolism dioxygenase